VTVVLWHIELSHYNEKVRWALDLKGVAHERRVPMPGFHRLSALAVTRGRYDRLPVADIEGRRLGDSTAIVAALEERWPDPPLYPADPADRARALALEDFFDERLAPDVRRWMWHQTLPDHDLVADSLFSPDARVRRRLLSLSAPVPRPFVGLV
jgi:glutathione S-transferase